jgi:enamine deaminase RidA (YjgF/YER057c/UK114 family)
MAAQVAQALDNVAALLAKAGFRFADVVRYDVHTTDVDAYLAASGPVAERFGERLPAGGILCQVARLAMPPLLVEITVTAVR